jgi:hypothetical protein
VPFKFPLIQNSGVKNTDLTEIWRNLFVSVSLTKSYLPYYEKKVVMIILLALYPNASNISKNESAYAEKNVCDWANKRKSQLAVSKFMLTGTFYFLWILWQKIPGTFLTPLNGFPSRGPFYPAAIICTCIATYIHIL